MSSRIVAQHLADGMVMSNANIYFTAHDNGGATVFRTAQSATPGNRPCGPMPSSVVGSRNSGEYF
jgi:hypothetical protein